MKMTKEYGEVLAALEGNKSLAEIQTLLKFLADSSDGIDCTDEPFGLTICMRAAAHGRRDVVEVACKEHKANIEQRNALTGANLLHYAAQHPICGPEIVRWAILVEKASDDLLNQQILKKGQDRDKDKDWDRGNGHTVAFEAVFNNNVGVVEALLEIEKDHRVDFTTPAVHGQRPLGWAITTGAREIVELLSKRLHPGSTDIDARRREEDFAAQYARREDQEWRDQQWRANHVDDIAALDLANSLRRYIVNGPTKSQWVKDLLNWALPERVDPNKPYGRFGQPMLALVPTHPDIMGITPTKEQQSRYTEVVKMLIGKGADPMKKEKGLMEVSAGFREVFFGYMDALEFMIESIKDPSKRESFVAEQGLFNGYTRLIDAALVGQTSALALLLAYNRKKNIEETRGFNGWTARDAAQRGNEAPAVVNLLFDALVESRL